VRREEAGAGKERQSSRLKLERKFKGTVQQDLYALVKTVPKVPSKQALLVLLLLIFSPMRIIDILASYWP
jgi:hypothetical protein